jgi:hypothetical protein
MLKQTLKNRVRRYNLHLFWHMDQLQVVEKTAGNISIPENEGDFLKAIETLASQGGIWLMERGDCVL